MIIERLVEYEHDGIMLEGLLAYDDGDKRPKPGVMISHTWGGRGEFESGKAMALAEAGYVGFALDLYGKGMRGGNPEENAKLMQPFMEDRALLQSRMLSSYDVLRSFPEVDPGRTAAMGFCFGGLCVLDLARTGADIGGVISLHGFLTPPGNLDGIKIKARVLVLHGFDDPMVPEESVSALGKELSSAGADWQIHIYGNTRHAFTNPKANDPRRGTVYNTDADRRSWRTVRNFLEEILGA